MLRLVVPGPVKPFSPPWTPASMWPSHSFLHFFLSEATTEYRPFIVLHCASLRPFIVLNFIEIHRSCLFFFFFLQIKGSWPPCVKQIHWNHFFQHLFTYSISNFSVTCFLGWSVISDHWHEHCYCDLLKAQMTVNTFSNICLKYAHCLFRPNAIKLQYSIDITFAYTEKQKNKKCVTCFIPIFTLF